MRVYLSNIRSRTWPIERQKAAHAGATPGWPNVTIYTDILSRRALMGRSPGALTERATMLRKTGRKRSDEEIRVAAWPVLGWDMEDFSGAVADGLERGATLIALNTGTRISPKDDARQMAIVMAEFEAGRKGDAHAEGRKKGGRISAAKRREDSLARARLIEADWKDDKIPTPELLLRAGRTVKDARGRQRVVAMAYNTATSISFLGKRPSAQANATAAAKRAAKRQEKSDDKPD